MSDPSPDAQRSPTSAADSPWFWVMLFSGAALVTLLLISPKYTKRQGRLELQYYARQEIQRRQVEGDHPPDDAPTVEPPAHGDLIIPLWPLATLCAAALVVSTIFFGRDRRRAPSGAPHARVPGEP